MGHFWLGDDVLDRYVLFVLRGINDGTCVQVTRRVRRILTAPDMNGRALVLSNQIKPDNEDVWCSLQRAVVRKCAEKFFCSIRQDIRYKALPLTRQ